MKQVGLLLVLLIIQSISSSEYAAATNIGEGEIWKPAEGMEYEVVGVNYGGGGRRPEAFKKCSDCKCCSGGKCETKPCCYMIDCNLPNKPAGTCALAPKSCNCTNCAA